LFDTAAVEGQPETDVDPYRTATAATAFGAVEMLANPIRFSTLDLPHNERLILSGADPPQWP